MLKQLTAAVLMAGFFGMTSVVSAQDASTDISGDATAVGVVLGNQTAVALGEGAEARAQAGVIANGTKVGGDATAVGVVLGNQTAVALGEDSEACAQAGVIGDSCNEKE